MWLPRAFFKSFTQSSSRARLSAKIHSARPVLEQLEDRMALSSNPVVTANAWAPIGPTPIVGNNTDGNVVAGRINAFAAEPSDTSGTTVYAGSAGGGVWEGQHLDSTDALTWTPLTDNLANQINDPYINLNVGALAAVPDTATNRGNNTTILYVGLGDANAESNLLVASAAISQFYGTGLVKGVLDYNNPGAGVQWTLLGGPGTSNIFYRSSISKIVVDPTNPNNIYVAVGTAKNGVTGHEGILRSMDGGNSWTNTTAAAIPGSNQCMFSDLVMNPGNPRELYAAIGDPAGGPLNGVYVTLNQGQTWQKMTNLPNGLGVGRITLAMTPVAPTQTAQGAAQYELWAAFMTDKITHSAQLTQTGSNGYSFSDFTGSTGGDVQTTLAAGQTLPHSGTFTLGVASTAGFPSSGTLYFPSVTTGGVTAQVAYKGLTGNSFTGCTVVAGAGDQLPLGTPVASRPQTSVNGAQMLTSSNTVLSVASTAGFPSSGVLYFPSILNPLDGRPIQVTYTGLTGTTFTGCTVLSGASATLPSGTPLTTLATIPFLPREHLEVGDAGTQEIATVSYTSPTTGTITFDTTVNPSPPSIPAGSSMTIQSQESTLLVLGYANVQGGASDASASLIVNPDFLLPVPNDFPDNNPNSPENYVGNQGYYNTSLIVSATPYSTAMSKPGSVTVFAGGMDSFLQVSSADTPDAAVTDLASGAFIHVDHHGIAILAPSVNNSRNDYTVLDGSDGGVWSYATSASATPGSGTWTDLNANSTWTNGLDVTQFYGIAVNPGTTKPGSSSPTPPSSLEVFGGVQDNGNARTTIPPLGTSANVPQVWQTASNDDGSLAFIDSTQSPENVFLSHAGLIFSNIPGQDPFKPIPLTAGSTTNVYDLNLNDDSTNTIWQYTDQPGDVSPSAGYGNSGGIGNFPGVSFHMEPVTQNGTTTDFLWYGGKDPSGNAALWLSTNGGEPPADTGAATKIASASDGETVPSATGFIYVNSTAGFPTSGTLRIATAAGLVDVSYTGIGSDSTGSYFSGCAGGSGTLAADDAVTIPTWLLIGSPSLGNGWVPTQSTEVNDFSIDNTTVDSIGANGTTPSTVYAGLRGGVILVTQNAPLDTPSSTTPSVQWAASSPVHIYSTSITQPIPATGGLGLFQSTLYVGSTAGFPSSGTLFIQIAAGNGNVKGTATLVTYTGKTATSFLGCSGAAGFTLTAGDKVTFQNDLRFSDILVDPQNANIAYVTASNFGDVTGGGHVWMTNNGGQTWTNISGNLPNVPVWCIQEQPGLPGTQPILFVGTDVGLYASANGGATWSRYGTGLPNTQVRALSLSQNAQYPNASVLVIGTWGHGAYEIPLAPIVNIINTPTTVPYSSVSQTITVSTTLLYGAATLNTTGGYVIFSLVPAGGSNPIASSAPVAVTVQTSGGVATGYASGSLNVPPALPPGNYQILVTYEVNPSQPDSTFFPFAVAAKSFNLNVQPPNRSWNR